MNDIVQIALILKEFLYFFRHIVVRSGLCFAILKLTLWYSKAEAFAVAGIIIMERRQE